MSDTATSAAPVEKKCRIEEVFDSAFIELIRVVPRNPYVRALILKLTGKMPGAESEIPSSNSRTGWRPTARLVCQ